MPIHDQGYRRYGGERGAARTRLGGDRRGRHPDAARQAARSSGCCSSRGCRSSSAPCRSTRRPTCRRRRFSRRRPRRSGSSSSSRQLFVFFITVYVGAGLIANDRRANALQIYLSKPLTRGRVRLRQAGDPDDVPAARHVGAGDAAAHRAGRVRRQLHVLPEQPVPVSGDHAVLAHRGRDGRDRDAGAVVAVEQQPVRRHPLRGADLLQPGASSACCGASRGDSGVSWISLPANLEQVGDAIFRCRCGTTRRGRCRCS